LSLLVELKRRRVFRAMVGYGIVAFALLQVAEPIMHGAHLPEVTLSFMVVGLALGFPIVVVLAWAFDVSGKGIDWHPPVVPGAHKLRGPVLALVLVAIGLLAAAPGLSWYFLRGSRQPASVAQTGIVSAGSGSAPMLPSVAVLPFADLSPQKDQEYFSDGLAEEILDALAHVEGLHVSARTSSFNFKGKNEDLAVIAAKLHVGSVLEGSVRKEGNRVRITAQLINAADGYHLWSQKFERDLTGVFAVQDEIARSVADALKVKLLPRQGIVRKEHGTTNPEVYTHFLLGQQFARGSKWNRAMEAFETALASDPNYAPAWAGLALTRFRKGAPANSSLATRLEIYSRALAEAEKGIALDPSLPEAYHARAEIRRLYKWDWAGAQADYERGLTLNPGHAGLLYNYAHLLASLGRHDEAIAAKRKASELDPLNATIWRGLAWMYWNGGKLDVADELMNRAHEIAPDSEFPWLRAGIRLLGGKASAALEWYSRESHEDLRLMGTAMAQHDMGRVAESQQALDDLVAKFRHSEPYEIADVYAWRGEADRAFDWLDRAYAERDTSLAWYVKDDPYLNKIRGDPRHGALLKKMNLPVD
jgi:TolB-like protein/Tfp pilus assembly protein PilF